jgi:hypothetical protein
MGELRIDSSERVRGGCEFRLRTKTVGGRIQINVPTADKDVREANHREVDMPAT